MKKKTSVFHTLYKIGVTLAYLAMIVILCWQALTPGKESADMSNGVGDKLNEVVTEIQKPEAERVDVSGLTVDGVLLAGKTLPLESVIIPTGQIGKVQTTVLPEDATNQALFYSSDDEHVLKAYADGKLEGIKAGTATVTVTAYENAEYTKTFSVTVCEVALERIALSAKKTTVYVGDSMGLDVTYTPANTTERRLQWHSSDTDVLTVSASGKVKGLAVGTATVTASSKANGEITDAITVTVKERPPVVEIPVTALTLEHGGVGYVGSSDSVRCSISPSDATNKNVLWYSSDPSVASVSQSGVVTYHKAGNVTVTAKSSEHDASDRLEITVKEVLSKTIELDATELNYSEKDGYSLIVKRSAKLTASLDEKATVLEVQFSSSAPEVAKVSQDGTIEAVALGEAVITVSTSYDGETKSVQLQLTVIPVPFSEQFENFPLWVRKAFGHFGAFLALGIAAALTYHTWFPKSTRGKILAFAVCLVMGFCVAGLTEILQLPIFTQGRGASFADVILDFRGYCCSSIVIFTWSILWNYLKALFKRNKLV